MVGADTEIAVAAFTSPAKLRIEMLQTSGPPVIWS